MSDELIEPFPVPEIFVDGFTEHILRDGVMSCVGYRVMREGRTIVLRLVWPAVNTTAAIGNAIDAMNFPADQLHKREIH